MNLKEQIHAWMAGREDEFIDALAPIIAVNSIEEAALPGMPFGPGPAEALNRALKLAAKWGFAAADDDGFVGLVDLNDKPDGLHILAHLDIVDAGTGWDTDPFTLTRKGDLIFGRGVIDDKGPAIAAMLAMRCVKELGLPLRTNAKLILGTNEESGFHDIVHYYASHPFAPNSISPDAYYPVLNCEKAMHALDFSHSWAPDTQGAGCLLSMEGGIRFNVVPGNCTARIRGLTAEQAAAPMAAVQAETGVLFTAEEASGVLTICAAGAQGHASTPEKGRNAITAMLDLLCRLPLKDNEAAKAVHGLHRFFPFGDHYGAALGIAQEDEVSGKLTLSPAILKMDEHGFSACYDCRACISATAQSTLDIAKANMEALGWTATGTFRPGHYVDSDSDFIRTLLRTYEDFTGKPGKCMSMGGGTYVHDIPGGVAFGAMDFDAPATAHNANEQTSLSLLMQTAEIYAAVIAQICG